DLFAHSSRLPDRSRGRPARRRSQLRELLCRPGRGRGADGLDAGAGPGVDRRFTRSAPALDRRRRAIGSLPLRPQSGGPRAAAVRRGVAPARGVAGAPCTPLLPLLASKRPKSASVRGSTRSGARPTRKAFRVTASPVGRGTPHMARAGSATALVAALERELEVLATREALAYWALATAASRQAQDAYAKARSALRRFLSQKDVFREIVAAREAIDRGAQEILSRQLDILYNLFLPNQVDEELIVRQVQLEAEIEAIHAAFRIELDG